MNNMPRARVYREDLYGNGGFPVWVTRIETSWGPTSYVSFTWQGALNMALRKVGLA